MWSKLPRMAEKKEKVSDQIWRLLSSSSVSNYLKCEESVPTTHARFHALILSKGLSFDERGKDQIGLKQLFF